MKLSDEILRSYREARYVIEDPEGHTDVPMDGVCVFNPRLQREISGVSGVIATAWNPFGEVRPFPVNHRANDQFAEKLLGRGKNLLGAYGEAQDQSWREDGFFVHPMNRDEAVQLCVEFAQNAVILVHDSGQSELIFHPEITEV